MHTVRRWLIRIAASERGQDMVEYALITTLISVAVILAVLLTGLIGSFETWATDVCNHVNEGAC